MNLKGHLEAVKSAADGVHVGFLSTFPPTECGIATFTEDLVNAIDRLPLAPRTEIIAINVDGKEKAYEPRVRLQVDQERPEDYYRLADYVNDSAISVLSVQHEFGIFGGEMGEYLIPLLGAVRKPVVTTLHTLLSRPPDQMRAITQEIVRRSEALVVMNSGAGHLLVEQYQADPAKIRLIHHGTPDFSGRSPTRIKRRLGLTGRTIIASFGLISRSKGLEYAVEAMAMIARRHPEALYLILGQTHPVVRKREGEVYREALEAAIDNYGLHDHVRFVNHYLTKEQLIDYLVATDIYLTPYLARNQLCSGALAYAAGAGKAIVSTPYWYALDILCGGRGMIVDFRDPRGIADACNLLLDCPALRQTLAARTQRLGRRMPWRHVAGEYVTAFRQAVRAGAASRVTRMAPDVRPLGSGVVAVGKKPV